MKTQIKQPEKASHTIQNKTKAGRQAPVEQILQRYIPSVERGKLKVENAIQREAVPDEDGLLQGKLDLVERGKLKVENAIQREAVPDEDGLLQGKLDLVERGKLKVENAIQREAVPDEDELLQGKLDLVEKRKLKVESLQRKDNSLSTFHFPLSTKNNTGLPDNLKSGIENLSGYSMDDVQVHYNSDKPAQLQALAYTQGTDIHVAPGQEKHLPHEAWHVVQQKQGRVQPTMQMQGAKVNDDEGLEKEADEMGGKVIQRTIWDDINIIDLPETPDQYVYNLVRLFPEFETLKNAANREVNKRYNENLTYSWRPEKGGGTSSAYYKDGKIFLRNFIPAMVLANTIFETANAAQADKFNILERDFNDNSINSKTPAYYLIEDLGENLNNEYQGGDKITKRAIIQERYEWDSFLLAKPTFEKIQSQTKELKGVAQNEYVAAFDSFNTMIKIDTFEKYYDLYGKQHRSSVEQVLRSIESEKKRCYITTACIEHKGLTDNCEELILLRKFRDGYLCNKSNGEKLIKLYYQYAPQIVEEIDKKTDKIGIYKNLYKIIEKCVVAIKNEDNEFAFNTYCNMVRKLYDEFIKESIGCIIEN